MNTRSGNRGPGLIVSSNGSTRGHSNYGVPFVGLRRLSTESQAPTTFIQPRADNDTDQLVREQTFRDYGTAQGLRWLGVQSQWRTLHVSCTGVAMGRESTQEIRFEWVQDADRRTTWGYAAEFGCSEPCRYTPRRRNTRRTASSRRYVYTWRTANGGSVMRVAWFWV